MTSSFIKINKAEPDAALSSKSGQLRRKNGFHITGFIYNKEGASAGTEMKQAISPNRTITLSLGLNDRMTFWGWERSTSPSLTNQRWSLIKGDSFLNPGFSLHTTPCELLHDPEKDGNWTKRSLVLIVRSLISSRLLPPSRFILISPKRTASACSNSQLSTFPRMYFLMGSLLEDFQDTSDATFGPPCPSVLKACHRVI